jgi:hypothetical protein
MKPNRHILKRIRSHSADRLRNDPAFENVRKNWNDFTTAARAAKLLRTVMESITAPVSDRSRHWQLTSALYNIVKSDTVHPAGERSLMTEAFHMLHDEELNTGIKFRSLFLVNTESATRTGRNQRHVTLCSTDPFDYMDIPPAVTHFEMIVAAANLNFYDNTYSLQCTSTEQQPLYEPKRCKRKFTLKVKQDKPSLAFLFFAIKLYGPGAADNGYAIRILNVQHSITVESGDYQLTPFVAVPVPKAKSQTLPPAPY